MECKMRILEQVKLLNPSKERLFYQVVLQLEEAASKDQLTTNKILKINKKSLSVETKLSTD
jgi:hypothetical protein